MSDSQAAEPPRLPVAPVVWVIVAAIAAGFAAVTLSPPAQQDQIGWAFALIPSRFNPASPDRFTHWYQYLGPIFGHIFLHAQWWHAAGNAFFFFLTARLPALRLGTLRFLALFFISGVTGALFYLALNWGTDHAAIGASGAVCGVFVAYFFSARRSWREAFTDPAVRGPLAMVFLLNVVLMGVFAKLQLAPIAWEAHLGGFVGGAISYILMERPVAPVAPAAPARPRGPWG